MRVSPRSTHLRALCAITSALVTVGLGVAVLASAPAATAAAACQVTYRADQWTGGYVGYVDITAGTAPIHGWTVSWTYGGDQKITSSWGATVTQTGAAVSAVNLAYNGEIAAGATVQFGVQGTYVAANPAPAVLLLNGSPCSASSPSPSVSASRSTSPSPSPSASRSASPSPSPSASPGGGCGTAVLCDGFEGQTGTTPTGAWTVTAPDCSGTGTATVDSGVAYRGTRSIKITGTEGYCNHVFIKATQSLTGIGQTWYGRFYVRHTTPLPASHVTFLAMKDANDGARDLRMGGQSAALQWNRQSDDATLPEQSPTGVALSTPLAVNQWTCVEFMVNGSLGTMQTWTNGTEVAGLKEDGVPTQNIDSQWLSRANWRPALTDLRLGWESYGTGADTLWFDEVALGATRIGC